MRNVNVRKLMIDAYSAIPPIDIVVIGEVLGSLIVPALKRIPHETRHIADKRSFFRIGWCVCLLVLRWMGTTEYEVR
jgi:hypothetical protein